MHLYYGVWGTLDLQLMYSKLLYIYLIARGCNLSSTWGQRDINLSARLHYINNMRRIWLWYTGAKSQIFVSCQKNDGWSRFILLKRWGECKNTIIIVEFTIKSSFQIANIKSTMPSVTCTISKCPPSYSLQRIYSFFKHFLSRCPCAHFLAKNSHWIWSLPEFK